MRAFLWRVVYAAVFFVLFWWVFPIFLQVIGFSGPSSLIELIRVVSTIAALAYVLFGPAPPFPF